MTKDKGKRQTVQYRYVPVMRKVVIAFVVAVAIVVGVIYLVRANYHTVNYPIFVGWSNSVLILVFGTLLLTIMVIGIPLALIFGYLLLAFVGLRQWWDAKRVLILTATIIAAYAVFMWSVFSLLTTFTHRATAQFNGRTYHVAQYSQPFPEPEPAGDQLNSPQIGYVALLLYECDESGIYCTLVLEGPGYEGSSIYGDIRLEHDPTNHQIIIHVENSRYYSPPRPLIYTYTLDEEE